MNACKCNKKDSAAMVAIKSSAGVTTELNLRNPLHTNEGPTLVLKTQGRRHQKSQIGTPISVSDVLEYLRNI